MLRKLHHYQSLCANELDGRKVDTLKPPGQLPITVQYLPHCDTTQVDRTTRHQLQTGTCEKRDSR